jgi:hypothetical protein
MISTLRMPFGSPLYTAFLWAISQRERSFMENNPEALVPVSAVPLENGLFFHSKVIGLDHFLVPEHQALRDGFMLATTSTN